MGATEVSLRALLFPASGKGLWDARVKRGEEIAPSKTPHLANSAHLGPGNLFLPQVCKFSCLPGRYIQGLLTLIVLQTYLAPLGELGDVRESNNSLSVKRSQDCMSLLQSFQQK